MNCSCCDLSLVPPPPESEAGRGGTPSGHRPPRTSSAGHATCRCERVTWGARPVARDPGMPARQWPSDLGPVQRVTSAQVTSVTVTPAAAREHETCAWGTCTRVRVGLSVFTTTTPHPAGGPCQVGLRRGVPQRGVAGVHGDMRTCRLPSAAWGVAPAFAGAAYSTSCARMCWETIRICETPCVVLDAELETWNKRDP